MPEFIFHTDGRTLLTNISSNLSVQLSESMLFEALNKLTWKGIIKD